MTALFADDVRGEAPYVTVDPAVAVTALKAVRDAIAGAYARPVLVAGRARRAACGPGGRCTPRPTPCEPDLGPQAEQVKALLAALPRLAARCHDPEGQALWDGLVDQSFVAESDRADARASAFSGGRPHPAGAACGRSCGAAAPRAWAAAARTCRTPRPADREAERVLALCLDAACALLVADALPDDLTALLTTPVDALVPAQRRPAG